MVRTLMAALLLVTALAGCGAGTPATSDATPATRAATPASSGATGGTTLRLDLEDLIKNQLASIDTAIGTNDVAEARAQMEGFQELWTLMRPDVEAVSADAAKEIDASLQQLSTTLMSSDTPTAADVRAATAELRGDVEGVITSLQ